jgi:hypothetical protein
MAELGARRPARKEEESTKRRRRKKRRGGVASRGCSRGVLLGLQAASRRWHSGGPAQDTQVCCLLEWCAEILKFGRDFLEK